MSAIPGRIDNRLVTWEGLKDYHNNFLRAIPKLGNENTVTGLYSFGLGQLNRIEKEYSLGLGYNNTITGQYSFGLGYNNTVTGDNNFVAGINLRASGSQTIFGKNNKENTALIFAVGNGASPEVPANAFEIDVDSNAIFGSDNEVSGSHNFLVGNHLIAKGSQAVFGQYNQEDENALFIIGFGDDVNRQNNFILSKKSSIIINNSNFIGLYDDINDLYSYSTDIIQASFCSGSNNKIYYYDYENVPHNSVILGGNNNRIASSINSFIIGGKNNIIASTSSTTGLLGDNLIATSTKKPTLIIGQYNDMNTNYSNAAFVIGGGSSEQDRKNLLAVGYDGELWLGNCYLSSPLYGKEKTELIWPEENALRHSLFPIQSNEGVWAIHRDMTNVGIIEKNLFINYRQPFEYTESSASSTSDYYVAPENIIFNAGSHDSYANLVAATYYNTDMTGHAVFYKKKGIGTPGVEYEELELPEPGLYQGLVGDHRFLISLLDDASGYFHVYDNYGVTFDYNTKKLSGSVGGYIAYLKNVRLILAYDGGWSYA